MVDYVWQKCVSIQKLDDVKHEEKFMVLMDLYKAFTDWGKVCATIRAKVAR